MTPEEALQIIDSVCAQVQTTREGHIKIQQAMAVLRQTIEQSKETEKAVSKKAK